MPAPIGFGLVLNGQPPITNVVVRVFTVGTSTYTPTVGMQFCIVEMVGGGGGGGGVSASTAGGDNSGGGGGAGAYVRSRLTAAQVGGGLAYTVGAKGTGGASGANDGNPGSDTTLGTTIVVAKGGAGGTAGSGTSSGGGGAGGLASSCTGDFAQNGMQGGMGIGGTITTINLLRAAGGNSYFGPGARMNVGAANGSAAVAGSYGGGGGGGSDSNAGGARSGGDGMDGVMIITEFCR